MLYCKSMLITWQSWEPARQTFHLSAGDQPSNNTSTHGNRNFHRVWTNNHLDLVIKYSRLYAPHNLFNVWEWYQYVICFFSYVMSFFLFSWIILKHFFWRASENWKTLKLFYYQSLSAWRNNLVSNKLVYGSRYKYFFSFWLLCI